MILEIITGLCVHENWEEWKEIISFISMIVTVAFSFVTIIITCYNANRQLQESEKSREQQKQQYEKNLKLQKEQYEKELEYNRNLEIIHEKPYFVFVNSSDFDESDSLQNTLTITFKNKGNGTAFHIIPDLESVNQGCSDRKIHIMRNVPIQDPIAMVGEELKTFWAMDKLHGMIGCVVPITINYKDASDRAYHQTFVFTISDTGNVVITNYANPELVK